MKFSIQLPTCTEGLVNPVPFLEPQEFVRMAQEAERLGYDAVWGNDHITPAAYASRQWPEPPNFYEVLMTLAVVGAHTSRIRLGTAVLVLPLRDPVLLAKQVSTLDRFTNGRVILGTGIGAYREEFDAQWPRRQAERRGDLLDESLAALQCLFRDTRATHEGRHFAFKDIAMRPKPLQDPLPIFVGGHNEAMIHRAARLGQGWLPGWRPFEQIVERVALLRRLTGETGRDTGAVEACSQFTLCIGKTVEAARARYRKTGMVRHRVSLAHTGRDPALAETHNLIGSPASILEQVAFLDRAGVDHVCALQFPSDTGAEMMEQIQWLAEEVMKPFHGH